MKIGLVCYPTFGGSGIVATELGTELAKRGHEVHFISYATPLRLNRFQDNIFFHEVEIPHYPLFEFHLYTLALAGKIIDVVKYENLELLHVHYAIPHAISGLLSQDILKDHNLKLVTTLHGTDITLVGLEPAFHSLVKYSLERSDAVTAVSHHLKEKTISQFTPNKDIDVIHNFIDTEIYKKIENCQVKKQLAQNGEKILMHISNFRKVKRVQDTVRILEKVREKHDAILVLIGDGPERAESERLVRELDLKDHVKFLGKQSGLVQLLSCADIFLLPSQSESFGLAALEAMSCSVPVVASNVGGIPELVKHGETGYVAEFGDYERMAKYVVDLLDNEKKHSAFAKASRKSASERFESNIIIPKYEELYQRTIDK